MADETTTDNFKIDGMLGAFFGNVSRNVFGNMNKQIGGLDSKFKRLEIVAQSSFQALRTGANRASDAIDSLNRGLREQADRIRNMPKMPSPPRQPSGGQPRGDDGRYLPGRGRGGGGSTRFGSRFSPGGGLGGISAFGGLGSVGALFAGASIARGFGTFDANLATIQAEAGLDKMQRKDVTGQILDLAGSTQFNTDEISSALIQMIRDGVKLNDALATVPNVLRLAVAESKDLQTAWNATNTIISGLNLPLSESSRLMDMMSNSTSLSKLQLEQIQYIAGQSLSLYSQIGGFSEEGFFGISGILGPLFRPERIGTGLKQLSLLLPQAAKGELAGGKNEIFASWGVNITDAAGNLKDEVSVLKEFEKAFAGMSGEARNVELAKVFGTEAAPVFSALIGKSAQLAENMEAIRKKGTLDEKFSVHAKSLTNQFKLLTSAGDSLIKKFVMILNEGNAFGGGIGWVTDKVTKLTTFMESNKNAIQSWWGNFKEILGVLFNLVEKGVVKFGKFWGGLGEGERTVLAIGAVIGAFLIGPVAGIIAAGALIIAKWEPIKSFFVSMWDDIIWETFEAWESITGTWGGVTGFFSGLWASITDTTKTAWASITDFFSDAWDVITSPARKAVSFFQDIWGGLPDKIKDSLRDAFGTISEKFGDFTNKLKAPMEQFFGWIGDKFEWLKTKVIEALNWLPGVEIGGGALVEDEKKPALPDIARLPSETNNMYKFRQMQERDKLRGLKEFDFNRFNTLEAQNEKLNKVHEQAIKRQRRLRAGTTAMGGFEMFDEYTKIAETTAVGGFKPFEEWKKKSGATHYETRAAKPVTEAAIAKPQATLTDFFKEKEKKESDRASERENFRKSFGIRTPEVRGVLGSRDIEDMYKIDDRAMSNVREHFEDTAEKEFFSGLQTYAEQSFAHIESTLTEAQRSMREKMWETQKFIKADKEKWQKIMDSGAFDRLSASMTASGERTAKKEMYDFVMGNMDPTFAKGLDTTQQEERQSKRLDILKDLIPDNMYSALADNWGLLSEKALYSPFVQKLNNRIDLIENNQKALKAAEGQRGYELLSDVMKTSDTVTQAEKRLSETDAGLLRNMYDYLKEFAPQLPMMQRLMGRESMLTGEPKGTKMNVFEFPTLTKEQHIELTSVFRSHFLSLFDVNSAQLAVLQQIAGLLGVQKIEGTLGSPPVIREQHGTLSDNYLSHRHSQVQKQVFENMSVEMPIVRPQVNEVLAPRVPVVEPTDTRFDELVSSLRMQPPTEVKSEGITAADEQVVKTSESEQTINNTFNITIEAGERSAEELYEEIMAIAAERHREHNF